MTGEGGMTNPVGSDTTEDAVQKSRALGKQISEVVELPRRPSAETKEAA